jgi:predicted NUDIX family NTP pyrophosphohydrolase
MQIMLIKIWLILIWLIQILVDTDLRWFEMVVHSAGILLFRFDNDKLEVMLVHPGGPFWIRKDDGAWSIPKGVLEEREDPLAAALREFQEETGFAIDGEFIALGELAQPSKKIIHAWALKRNLDETLAISNRFSLEWPRGSGNMKEYPEIDKARWFDIEQARKKIQKGQEGFIDRLLMFINHQDPR